VKEDGKVWVKGSDFIGKNVVNMYDGARICTIQNIDFTFDGESGEIRMLSIPARNRNMFRTKRMMQIPWESIRKIGKEVIIVDIGKLSR